MDYTSRMVALLTELRRERNGAVADSMRYYGTTYGLNYGVSLPTVRALARAQKCDHDFARFLYRQEVRELQLVAVHLADPARLTVEESVGWGAGIINSEIAEEAAFALLSHAEALPELFRGWIISDEALLQYAVLLSGARSRHLCGEWVELAVDALRRRADEDALHASCSASDPSFEASYYPWASRLVGKGTVALLVAFAMQNKENRQTVTRLAGSLRKLRAEDRVHEELTWRLEL